MEKKKQETNLNQKVLEIRIGKWREAMAFMLGMYFIIFMALIGILTYSGGLIYVIETYHYNLQITMQISRGNITSNFTIIQGKYIPNYHENNTKYTPDLVCISTYNSMVGWSTPYNCVK